jgi:hypothetical protein
LKTPKPAKRFLTSNRHETFLAELIGVGGEWDVLSSHPKERLDWNTQRAAVPQNARLVQWSARLKDYDAVIIHTLRDLRLFWGWPNIIIIIHIALLWHTPFDVIKSIVKIVWLKIFSYRHSPKIVFVSDWKKSTWKLFSKEQVINLSVPNLDHIESGRSFDTLRCGVVGNEFTKRRELNFELVKRIKMHFELSMFGLNPDIPYAKALARDEFLAELAKHNLFIYTTPLGYNDGYNTAMLEAMALGIPVLTLAHVSSPIEHGLSGFVAGSNDEMIEMLSELKQNPEQLITMGERARQKIVQEFSQSEFRKRWIEVIF